MDPFSLGYDLGMELDARLFEEEMEMLAEIEEATSTGIEIA